MLANTHRTLLITHFWLWDSSNLLHDENYVVLMKAMLLKLWTEVVHFDQVVKHHLRSLLMLVCGQYSTTI